MVEPYDDSFVMVGYDADTQVYTWKDREGNLWEFPPGNKFGLPPPPHDPASTPLGRIKLRLKRTFSGRDVSSKQKKSK
ncbi:hypothetical protein QBC47DRAFT_397899 [Echria macrotheca]|uniref:Uncharacterized protein n=1 Tax=Echria macrotheca TaxID=438768 RepID=A0AAJ0BNC9_9PEZI|nr:hypothetical protein QBC47DRAFT_397899 [Echria macrotheca]